METYHLQKLSVLSTECVLKDIVVARLSALDATSIMVKLAPTYKTYNRLTIS